MNALPVEFGADPAWPWSLPRVGLPALAVVAVLLALLTVWTYGGAPNSNRRRITLVIALRLLALVLALLTLLRPSFALRSDLKVPSKLIIAADASKSQTIRDEVDNKSRWATLQRILADCQPQLDRLRDEQNIQVVLARFADEVAEYDPAGAADGPRTDFGRLLHTLRQQHGNDRHLRGLLILSDGADNGTLYPALAEAAGWRALGCPISTFGLGQTTTGDLHDVALTAVTPEPSPVPIKAKLTVRATLDAPGFVNRTTRIHLLLDDKEVLAQPVQLLKETGNEVLLTTDAPPTPGEVKLTVKADPLPGEASVNNNEISTYLTVTKEGLSVLIVDKLREELKFIRYALSGDPRIRLFEAVRQTDAAPTAAEADLYNFDKQAYDVIILGDVSAKRLRAGNLNALSKIEELVKDKGVGLLMMGGMDSLGGDWNNTPVANALPVQLDGEQVRTPVLFVPKDDEAIRTEYALRLAANPTDNKLAWDKLRDPRARMEGFTRLGTLKPTAKTIAANERGDLPLLVKMQYGKGRTMALAVDMTWLWTGVGLPKSTEGMDLHAKFWKQMVVWLAQQEDQEGSVWVRPDARRLAAGGKLGFAVGLRGKTGIDLPEGQFEVQVIPPSGTAPEAVATARERDGQRGTFWKTDKPGEYRLEVRGTGKDVDGTPVNGVATARFLIYQDDTELLRQAADHDFLTKLAAAGGGKFHRADELPKFLQELEKHAPTMGRTKANYWPDWRRTTLGGFLPSLFVLFVGVLSLEWGLRRWWGMV